MKGVYNIRPCLLKVSGLNSFVQEEVIDFSKLIERGLFGIFGPTGSGKSSILDAVTIALYGKIARDTKEFINKEIGELYVSFQFKMGNDNTDYTVERKLKINNDTGYLTTYVRLAIRKNDELIEVFDGVNEINAEIEDIIGLNHEDFMRTVVLPQGKFSKFLKLTGTERRNMLERILKLEEFGEILMDKLRTRKNKRKNELVQVETILANYEEISQEKLMQERATLKELKKKENDMSKKLKIKNKDYEKYKNIWEYQKELAGYIKQLAKLIENDEKNEEKKDKCERTKNAVSIKSEINRFDRYTNDFKQNSEVLTELEKAIKELEEKQKKIKKEYDEALSLNEKEIPELAKKKERISSAKNLYDENKELKNSINESSQAIKIFRDNESELKKKISSLKKGIEENTSLIKEKEDKIEELKVKVDYRQKIDSGLSIEKDYNKSTEQLKEIKEELEKKEKEIGQLKLQYKEGEEKIRKTEGSILYRYQENISSKREELKEASVRKEKLEKDIKDMKEKLEKITVEIEDIKTKNQAGILAQRLKEDVPCPVCGSIEHPQVADDIDLDIEEFLKNRNKLEKQLEELKKESRKVESSIGIMQNEIETLDKNKEEFISTLRNESNVLENYKRNSEQELDVLKRQMREAREAIVGLSTDIENQQGGLKALKKKKEEIFTDNKELKETYNNMLAEYNIKNFAAESKAIIKKDREREAVETSLTELKKEHEEDFNKKDKHSEELTDLEKKASKLAHKLETAEEEYSKNEEKIRELIGDKEPDVYLEKVETRENHLKQSLQSKKEESDRVEKSLSEKKSNYHSIKTRIEDIRKEIASTRESLDKKKDEFEFVDIAEARKLLDSEGLIEKWDMKVKEHEEMKKDLLNNIARINKELQGESISEEDWNKIITVKEELEKELSTLNQRIGSQKEVIKTAKKELKIKNKQLDKKKKLEHKLSLINAIDKLIRGKSFVEFVAIRQLRYIAREASRRLLEITNNRYQLELDNQGEFVICDNYLGGVKRGCNTLSGGETFLSSLALALALSSQIQLKGSLTMEFFFLDEGFGTLDENLLDIVMSSLEKLQNENLSVGIISHVKELRNRVPVKLMVDPAESGLHGSKVKIEYS